MYGVLGSPPVESAWGGTNREGASEWSQAYDFGDGYTSIASGSSADTRASTWSWAETYDELYETFYVESYGEILVVTDPLAIRTVRDSASWSSTDNSEGSVYAGTGPAGSSSTNRTWQSSHEQSREFHSEDWWTPLGGSHESTTLEGWSSGGEQSWSYSGPDGSWSIGGTWSDAVTPPAVEESWSWGTPPAEPLVTPEYAGPDDADYGDLISAIAAESLGAYNEPATRDAAVDAAILAFVSLDADDQGQGGGEMYAATRASGEGGGGEGSDTSFMIGPFRFFRRGNDIYYDDGLLGIRVVRSYEDRSVWDTYDEGVAAGLQKPGWFTRNISVPLLRMVLPRSEPSTVYVLADGTKLVILGGGPSTAELINQGTAILGTAQIVRGAVVVTRQAVARQAAKAAPSGPGNLPPDSMNPSVRGPHNMPGSFPGPSDYAPPPPGTGPGPARPLGPYDPPPTLDPGRGPYGPLGPRSGWWPPPAGSG